MLKRLQTFSGILFDNQCMCFVVIVSEVRVFTPLGEKFLESHNQTHRLSATLVQLLF